MIVTVKKLNERFRLLMDTKDCTFHIVCDGVETNISFGEMLNKIDHYGYSVDNVMLKLIKTLSENVK